MAGSNELVIRVVGDSTQFTRTINQVNRAIDRASGNTRQFGQHGVTSVQAISASLRLAEGNFTNLLRASERFIALSPALSGVAKAIFPLVGGIAVGTIFARMGKEAYDFIQTINKIPSAVQQGYASLEAASQTENDRLQITNDKLEMQIAKLEHKPINNLALAFDEARLHAEEFSNTISKTLKQVDELTSKNSMNFLTAFAIPLIQGQTPKAGTGSATDWIAIQNQNIQAIQQRITSADFRGDQAGVTQGKAELQKQLLDTISGADLFKESLPTRVFGKPLDQSLNRSIIDGYVQQLQQVVVNGRLQDQNVALQGQYDKDVAGKEAARQAEQTRKAAEQALEERIRFRDRMVEVWRIGQTEDSDQVTKQIDLVQKWADAENKSDDGIIRKRQELAATLEKHSDEMAAIQMRSTIAFQENILVMQEQSGQISAHNAAIEEARLHAAAYADELDRLNAAIDSAKLSGNTQEQFQLEQQRATLSGSYRTTAAQDQAAIYQTTAAGGFSDALNQFVTASRDAAAAMRDITTNTLRNLNEDILSGRGFQRTGSDLFRSVAGYGLQKAEGSILSAFGFGGASKPDGSASNPLYVRIAGLIGAATLPSSLQTTLESGGGSGVTGLLSNIALQGFFAAGGDVVANRPAIVGERGPEMFVPHSAGTIVPNSSLGGTTNHVYVDASGSQDPTATEAAVHRAMQQYLPYTVGASVSAVREYQARRPLSAR